MVSTIKPTKKLRVGVVGTGKISAEHLKFLCADPRIEVGGACDLSMSLAKYATDYFRAGVPHTDYKQMLASDKFDVVHVCTPPHTHGRIVTDCIDAGAHVIVEKPVALTNTEFRALWNHAQSHGRLILEDHNYRFNWPIRAIEELLAAGELGEVREVDVRMALAIRNPGGRYADESLPHPSHKLPAGVIHEFITHLCYLALRFMPPIDIGRVRAAWSKHGDEGIFKYDDLDALVIGGPAHARIRFTSHSAPDGFAVTVRGTKGAAFTDLFYPHLRVDIRRKGGEQLSPLVNQLVNGVHLMRRSVGGFVDKVLQRTAYEGLHLFLKQTYDAIELNTTPPVTFEDMDSASRLVDALLDQANRF
jgi:predicted dehydrogenase